MKYLDVKHVIPCANGTDAIYISLKACGIKQNDETSNIWRKRVKTDGQIDFRMESQAIYNLVRALSKPYVGAHINYKEKEITVWKVEIVENKQNNIESGKVLDINEDKILVKTYDGAIRITHHEFKKLPNIGEYL